MASFGRLADDRRPRMRTEGRQVTVLPRFSRREPLEIQIQRQRAKLARLDEQLGRAMSRRADEEEKLADLLILQGKLEG